jgi:hypothetical protein
MPNKNSFARWLDIRFVDWMREQGGSKKQVDFAEWLGVDPVTLNRHLSGARKPDQDDPIIQVYAQKLGPEVYDVLRFRRPDPQLDKLIEAYDKATDEQREEIIRQAFHLIGFERET